MSFIWQDAFPCPLKKKKVSYGDGWAWASVDACVHPVHGEQPRACPQPSPGRAGAGWYQSCAEGRSEQPLTCRSVGAVTHRICVRWIFRGRGRRVYQGVYYPWRSCVSPWLLSPKSSVNVERWIIRIIRAGASCFPFLSAPPQSLSMTEQIWLQASGCEAYFLICPCFFPLGAASETNTYCSMEKSVNLLNPQEQTRVASQLLELGVPGSPHPFLTPALNCSLLSPSHCPEGGGLSHLPPSYTQEHASPQAPAERPPPPARPLQGHTPYLHRLFSPLPPDKMDLCSDSVWLQMPLSPKKQLAPDVCARLGS